MREASIALSGWLSRTLAGNGHPQSGPQDMADFDSETLLRDYLGFGTGFELGALVFFFAALAFCFCAACLCVAFGDLSPMNRKVRFLTIGVNTDRHRSDEISDRPMPLFTKRPSSRSSGLCHADGLRHMPYC